MILGALEAGGTKMVCSIGNERGEISEQVKVPTTTPAETMLTMIEYFKEYHITALGIGSFGPLDLNKASPTYGYITSSPKLAWADYPLLPAFVHALNVPAEIDTDVNVAALAEYRMGAAKGLRSCLYVTIGTGVGGGLIAENNLVHGLVHPEFGHMLLRPAPNDPAPDGFCPYHKGCLEGLASGPAIEKRWGKKACELPKEHIAWQIEAEYLAQMCANAIVCFSPEKIILGGGVMQQTHLFPRIHARTQELLGNYVRNDMLQNHIAHYIVPPALATHSGAVGALLLALKASER